MGGGWLVVTAVSVAWPVERVGMESDGGPVTAGETATAGLAP